MKLCAVAFTALITLPIVAVAQGTPVLDGRLKKIRDSQSEP